jgi:predicted nucleic acid-binding protein
VSFLLDTNVISELRKGPRTNPGVRDWFDGVAGEDVHLSVVVIGELRQGIERVRKRDARSAANLERWLDVLVEDYGARILPVDLAVADLWGRLNVPDPLPAIDGFLAATALIHDLTLVTRDVRGVKSTGVATLNPFKP